MLSDVLIILRTMSILRQGTRGLELFIFQKDVPSLLPLTTGLLLFARYPTTPESALPRQRQQFSNLWSAGGLKNSKVIGVEARGVGLDRKASYGGRYLEHPYDKSVGTCVLSCGRTLELTA